MSISTSLPVVDEQRITSTYAQLGQMSVTLDADPLQFGPGRLNEKVSDVRAMMTRCEHLYLQVSQDLHAYRRAVRRIQAEYEMRESELLATDPDVRGRSNLTDRKAVIAQKLKPEIQMRNSLTFVIQDLEALEKIVTVKRQDLRDLQARLKDQIQLCREQIGTGERWKRGAATGFLPPAQQQGSFTPTVPQARDEVDVAEVISSVTSAIESLGQEETNVSNDDQSLEQMLAQLDLVS